MKLGLLLGLAVLLSSGYCKVLSRNLSWADAPDTRKSHEVSCTVKRNRFRKILSNLHLADNTQITEDRYYKVQVLEFQQYGSFANHSVDESIIPYYGKHVTKKITRGMPIRFAFKFWCITSSEGYLVYAELYCQADTDLSDTGLDLGADVVLGLTEKFEVKAGLIVTFDNLFTSLPLLHELTKLGIGALGTLQQNRCHGATIPNKTTLAQKPRGSYDFDTDGKNMVMSWLDNKVVTCATIYVTSNPISTGQ